MLPTPKSQAVVPRSRGAAKHLGDGITPAPSAQYLLSGVKATTLRMHETLFSPLPRRPDGPWLCSAGKTAGTSRPLTPPRPADCFTTWSTASKGSSRRAASLSVSTDEIQPARRGHLKKKGGPVNHLIQVPAPASERLRRRPFVIG